MTWAELIDLSAAALNDTAQEKFTDIVMIPYLNMSLIELQELFELNDIPVAEETSAIITLPANTSAVKYIIPPALPDDLIEIKQLWESPTGLDQFSPMTKRNYLTPSLSTVTRTSFGIWAWLSQEIRLLPAASIIDLKIDYVRSLFNPVTISTINGQNVVRNTDGFLYNRSAAHAAFFIDENKSRSDDLTAEAGASLQRSLGISVKGMQSVVTRRRPFRAAFKRTRTMV